MNDGNDFWDSLEKRKAEEKLTEEQKEVVSDVAKLPATQSSKLEWRKEDSDLFGYCPDPLSIEDSRSRMDYIQNEINTIKSSNCNADTSLFRDSSGSSLLSFDASDEDMQKTILKNLYAEVSPSILRRHRTSLYEKQVVAKNHIEATRSMLRKDLKITGESIELDDDEFSQLSLIYDWLCSATAVKTFKWITYPRKYRRSLILSETMVRLLINTGQSSVVINFRDLQRWVTGNNQNTWKVATVTKDLIFILVSERPHPTFWDICYEHFKGMVDNSQAVIVVSHFTGKDLLPSEVTDDYLALANSRENALIKNYKGLSIE